MPWTEEPGRLPSTGSQRVRHDWATKPQTSAKVHERTWVPSSLSCEDQVGRPREFLETKAVNKSSSWEPWAWFERAFGHSSEWCSLWNNLKEVCDSGCGTLNFWDTSGWWKSFKDNDILVGMGWLQVVCIKLRTPGDVNSPTTHPTVTKFCWNFCLEGRVPPLVLFPV